MWFLRAVKQKDIFLCIKALRKWTQILGQSDLASIAKFLVWKYPVEVMCLFYASFFKVSTDAVWKFILNSYINFDKFTYIIVVHV